MAELDPNTARPEGVGPPRDAPNIDLLFVEITALRPEFSVRELLGEHVANDAGEEIGSIDDLLVEDDRVAYAVLSVGGFLGLGGHKVVTPFDSLLTSDEDIILPGASKEVLGKMGAYDRERVRMDRRSRRTRRDRDEPEIVQTAGGQPIPRTIADITDGDT